MRASYLSTAVVHNMAIQGRPSGRAHPSCMHPPSVPGVPLGRCRRHTGGTVLARVASCHCWSQHWPHICCWQLCAASCGHSARTRHSATGVACQPKRGPGYSTHLVEIGRRRACPSCGSLRSSCLAGVRSCAAMRCSPLARPRHLEPCNDHPLRAASATVSHLSLRARWGEWRGRCGPRRCARAPSPAGTACCCRRLVPVLRTTLDRPLPAPHAPWRRTAPLRSFLPVMQEICEVCGVQESHRNIPDRQNSM